MYATTPSGLLVPYATADERRVTEALQRLDRGLFLDKELDHWGREVWVVRHHIASGQPPVDVLYWADPDGTPRAPSMAIVDQVAAQEKRTRADRRTGRDLAESGRRVKAKQADVARQDREDIYREHEPRLKAGHGKPVTITTPLRAAS